MKGYSLRKISLIAATIAGGIVAVAGVTGLSVGAVTGLNMGQPLSWPASGSSCSAPQLAGTAVNVTLSNMGGPMMGGGSGMMPGGGSGGMARGAMRLSSDRAIVGHGTVSFLVTNNGSVSHELVVLPLSGSQTVGTRPLSGETKVEEAGSVGEASSTCGAGAGEGIAPGASSWVTLKLAPGRYELVCNLPGHYSAGMYTELTVS
ncbi:sulfocyanin-like copper-binding protein [Frigoribacterium sp. UYMn621]|uniref:sulfocyanin-like copper-binding protein n=1 Tax=Frigoribacterium sp. UYMn621 TaxID=3156343 RepID=UPI00339B2D72